MKNAVVLNSFADLSTVMNVTRKDDVNVNNGYMHIYPENLNTYLAKYACRDFEDLQETLYTSYGIFVKLIEQ